MIFSEGLNPWLLGECFWTRRSAKLWILSATLWTLTLHLETSRFWSLTIFRPNIKYHNTVTQIGIMIVIWYGSKGWYQFSSTVSPPFKKHDTSYLNDSYYFKTINSNAVGIAASRPNGLKIYFVRKSIFGSAALFFVFILIFIFTSERRFS